MSGECTIEGEDGAVGQPRWPFNSGVLRNALRQVETQPGDIELMAAAPLMLEALEAEQAYFDHENRMCDLPGRGEMPSPEVTAAWREYDLRHVQLEQRAITLRTAALDAARGESPTRNEET